MPHRRSWHSTKACFRFQATGECSFGAFCPYSHPPGYPKPKPRKKKYVEKEASRGAAMFNSPKMQPSVFPIASPPVAALEAGSELRLKIFKIKEERRREELDETFGVLRKEAETGLKVRWREEAIEELERYMRAEEDNTAEEVEMEIRDLRICEDEKLKGVLSFWRKCRKKKVEKCE